MRAKNVSQITEITTLDDNDSILVGQDSSLKRIGFANVKTQLRSIIGVDEEPTADSTNLIESGPVKTIQDDLSTLSTGLSDGTVSPLYAQKVGDSSLSYSASELQSALAGKQAALTFDTTPTASSTNPVTSEGIRAAIAASAASTSLASYQFKKTGDIDTDTDEVIALTAEGISEVDNITIKITFTGKCTGSVTPKITFNGGTAYPIYVPKDGALSAIGYNTLSSVNYFWQAYTTLELYFDSDNSVWVISGNPTVLSSSDATTGYAIKADGSKLYPTISTYSSTGTANCNGQAVNSAMNEFSVFFKDVPVDFSNVSGWYYITHGIDTSIYKILAATILYNEYYKEALNEGGFIQVSLNMNDNSIILYNSGGETATDFNTVIRIIYCKILS